MSAFAVETEFLGVDPVGFVEDAYNAVYDYIGDACDAVETALMTTVGRQCRETPMTGRRGAGEQRNEEIHTGCEQLHHSLVSLIDRNFDKFEIYSLRNILKVPEAVVKQIEVARERATATHTYNDYTATEAEEAELTSSITRLQNQILVERARRRALRSLRKHAASQVPQCEGVVAQVAAMVEGHSAGSATVDDVIVSSKRLDAAVAHLRTTFSIE